MGQNWVSSQQNIAQCEKSIQFNIIQTKETDSLDPERRKND